MTHTTPQPGVSEELETQLRAYMQINGLEHIAFHMFDDLSIEPDPHGSRLIQRVLIEAAELIEQHCEGTSNDDAKPYYLAKRMKGDRTGLIFAQELRARAALNAIAPRLIAQGLREAAVVVQEMDIEPCKHPDDSLRPVVSNGPKPSRQVFWDCETWKCDKCGTTVTRSFRIPPMTHITHDPGV